MATRTKSWAAGTTMATRGVLAGAYKGKDLEGRAVSHVVLVDAEGWEIEGKTICRRVLVERLADGNAPGHLDAPTCPECAKRAAR